MPAPVPARPADLVHALDARGLSFECLPECGFCCTASPLVLPHEAGALGSLVTRAADGALRIPIRGIACGSLQGDARCGSYDARPAVCRVYPYQAHAGRRVQVVVTLACPGVREDAAVEPGGGMEAGAQETARLVLAQPGAAEMAQRAKETFAEFDRRMREWGVHAAPDRLRAAFLPHLARLARPESLSAFFAGLAAGDLVIEGKPPHAVGPLFDAEPEATLDELLHDAARDAFADNADALWVEPDHRWTQPVWRGDRLALLRHRPGIAAAAHEADPADLPTAWTEGASAELARYLERLCHRDHTEGAAAWLVDQSGYQATLPAAFGRVLAEAALQVVLRAGLLAAEAGADAITPEWARRGIAAYETSYHSLPTIGGIL